MVWIRRVRTASGATAVQIAESVDGRRRIVRHVGSARDDAELGLLLEEVLAVAQDADDGVTVDADVISGVGLHCDGVIVAATRWSSW
ncbi:hypothetical protein KXD97_24455 [Mycobacterium sp. SMC-8]|uniref:hypothetical protein n=1 Tax=Mycobacterium sp. SMC-8 TaxID=2857060 RepID=UPI0021B326E5|nr:hypothetical protein [Mycobacterium sp. SMC-8]UXA11166.1 hypothetical protein KXD97_24455 [Mycobacterium sp. SMC-8]